MIRTQVITTQTRHLAHFRIVHHFDSSVVDQMSGSEQLRFASPGPKNGPGDADTYLSDPRSTFGPLPIYFASNQVGP